MQSKTCSQCKNLVLCNSLTQSCWCMTYPGVLITDAEKDCMCPNCLALVIAQNENMASNIQENYYIENGLYVFTEAYHLKRGYCCQNGCRHCPYGFKKS